MQDKPKKTDKELIVMSPRMPREGNSKDPKKTPGRIFAWLGFHSR